MTNFVADAEQRLQALDPTRSFIVQAPAGSGKTELLIQRFLTLLARVDRPEAVVAITFTRKAAAEMRHRIIAALRHAEGPPPAEPHEKHTWLLARDALARNDKMNWRLSEHPSRLHIQTIDSLCAMLVRQMPWVSRMGALLRPDDDAGDLYDRAARLTVTSLDARDTSDDVSIALSKLLTHLDNHVARIERLLSVMLGTRDQWMRYVNRGEATGSLRKEMEDSISRVITNALEEADAAFPGRFRRETVELARFAAGNRRNAGLDEENPEALDVCYGLMEFPDVSVVALPVWLGIAEMFLTKTGGRRQRVSRREGFPASETGRAAKERLLAIELDEAALAPLHALRALPRPGFKESEWNILDALLLLLPLAVDRLRQVFQEERRVDFIEIAIGARTALGTDTAPTELSHALDGQIRHLMVDEFQDTSHSQYELITGLIRDWQPDDGRTLFLVGDPMQSIYAFREAEVGLFMQTRTKGIGALRPTPLILSVNFRSTPNIVGWVNTILSAAFPDTENVLTGAVTYAHATAFKSSSDYSKVSIHACLGREPETEAERVVEIIDEAQAEWPEETIAVLVLVRNHLVHIVSALQRHGKKFRAVDIEALGERPVVQDLLALTRALTHSGNRLAWLSILRAPWCGLTLADLEALAGGGTEGSIWDLVRDGERQDRLPPDGRARVRRMIPILEDAFARRGRLPLRRMVEGVWTALGGPACLESRTDLEDAGAYLDLLEEAQDSLGVPNETKFTEDVARLFAGSDVEASDKLQLMTIHKAKGLEFDTVILPGLGRTPRPEEKRLLMWREVTDSDRPRLLLAPIPGFGEDGDALLYKKLRRMHAVRQGHERDRLLYVATTRARKCLHLLGHAGFDEKGSMKNPSPRSLLSRIWKSVRPLFEAALKPRKSEAVTEDQVDEIEVDEPGEPCESKLQGVPLKRLVSDWTLVPMPEDIAVAPQQPPIEPNGADKTYPAFEWASELQRRVGLVVHRMLQRMQAPDHLDFSAVILRTALRREGLDGDKLDEAVSRAVSALENTIRDDRGRWILSLHEDDKREFAMSTAIDGRIRRRYVDRTFVDGGERWIIDYKTGAHTGGNLAGFLDSEQERYRAQLEGYASLIRTMDSRPIFLGLYFPLLQEWRAWEYEG